MIFIIIVSLLVLLPYYSFLRKRYKESNDKKLFLENNFYGSNLWIVLLIVVSLLVVNAFAPVIEEEEEPVTPPASFRLDSLENIKTEYRDNIDFHFNYLDVYAESKVLVARDDGIIDKGLIKYYNSLDSMGFESIASWAKGYYFLKIKRYDSSIYYLQQTPEELKYRSYVLGKAFAAKEKDSTANEYFKSEIILDHGAKELATHHLIRYHNQAENLVALSEVIDLPGAEQYFPFDLARRVHFTNVRLIRYYGVVFKWFFKSVNPIGIVAATLILGVWFMFLTRLAFFQKLRLGELIACFSLGAVFAFLTFLFGDFLFFKSENSAFWNTFTWSIIGIGAVEEFVKILPLLVMLLFSKRKFEAYEYIMYASVSALGFAFSENLLYFKGEYGLIISGRAITSAVGHMIFSSVFSYGLVLVKFKLKGGNVVRYFLLFWLAAAVLHGLYDYWLFINMGMFFIMFFLLIARIWSTIINNSINQSANFSYNRNFNTRRLQFYLAFSLTAIFMFEYLVTGFSDGVDQANVNLFFATFSGGFLIAFLGSKLSSLNLMKGYWAKINYSVNPFGDDVIPQNFVGQTVKLSTYYVDQGLVEYFPSGEVSGKIINRVILQNKMPDLLKNNDDAGWFLVKLDEQLMETGFRSRHVLVKLKDNYSSLNDRKNFMSHFLIIPEYVDFKDEYPMRKEFKSLGWVFLSGVAGIK